MGPVKSFRLRSSDRRPVRLPQPRAGPDRLTRCPRSSAFQRFTRRPQPRSGSGQSSRSSQRSSDRRFTVRFPNDGRDRTGQLVVPEAAAYSRFSRFPNSLGMGPVRVVPAEVQIDRRPVRFPNDGWDRTGQRVAPEAAAYSRFSRFPNSLGMGPVRVVPAEVQFRDPAGRLGRHPMPRAQRGRNRLPVRARSSNNSLRRSGVPERLPRFSVCSRTKSPRAAGRVRRSSTPLPGSSSLSDRRDPAASVVTLAEPARPAGTSQTVLPVAKAVRPRSRRRTRPS